MGSISKETYTKPRPRNAEQFTRKGEAFARWHDRRGWKHTAKVTVTDAETRIIIEAGIRTRALLVWT